MSDLDDIIMNEQNGTQANKKEQPAETKNEKSFDKEAWAKRRQEIKNDVYAMLDKASSGLSDPLNYVRYLAVQSRFDRYAVSNSLLVAHQMPEALKLRDLEAWNKAGVYIKKNETGIYILEPGKEFKREDGSVGTYYEPKKVFDITQTTAVQKIPPKKRYNERVLIKVLVNTSPVPVEIRNDLPENVSALYRSEDKVIHIRQGMKGDDIFRALSKEIAHARLDKGDYSRDKCEVAAYGIAFISCARAGIDPADIDRKKNPFEGKNPKDIRQELSAIRDEANSMSQSMSKILDAKNKNRDAR